MYTKNYFLNSLLLLFFFVIVQIRNSNTLVYTGHSAYGCFVAIAVPLNIPHHNAFVSYNFETAYGLPKDAKVFFPGTNGYQGYAIKKETNENNTQVEALHEDSRQEPESSRNLLQNNDLEGKINRKHFIKKRAIYQMLQDKLKISGYKGGPCLLKLVCEINASMIGKNNGVLGTILHILLSPSSSTNEKLPQQFYKAQSNGIMGDCSKYEKKCPYSLLDLFSVPIERLLRNTIKKSDK